jgi:hypothetical protein
MKKRKASRSLRLSRINDIINEIKSEKSCMFCGESHPAALDFHHRNPEEKLYQVSKMRGRDYSMEKVLAEIEKCDLICSNCHRKIHWFENQGRGPAPQ